MTNPTTPTPTYLLSDKDIQRMASGMLTGALKLEQGRSTYLRMLIASAQSFWTLGAPGARDQQGQAAVKHVHNQQAALRHVHNRAYRIVKAVMAKGLHSEHPDAAKELNRRTNFARTAAYAVREWLKAGGDLMTLEAGTATKASLEVPKTQVLPSADLLHRRSVSASERALDLLAALGDVDRESMILGAEKLIGRLEGLLNKQSVMIGEPEVQQGRVYSSPFFGPGGVSGPLARPGANDPHRHGQRILT
jgi:hypothetical protein